MSVIEPDQHTMRKALIYWVRLEIHLAWKTAASDQATAEGDQLVWVKTKRMDTVGVL